MSNLDSIAKTGARWWADQIRNGFVHDIGADLDDGGLLGLLAAKTAEQVTSEKVDRFENELAQRMLDELRGNSTSYFFALRFGTDYGPSDGLADALEAAGLPTNSAILPMKSRMWADANGVSVSAGYRAEVVELEVLDCDPASTPEGGRDA